MRVCKLSCGRRSRTHISLGNEIVKCFLLPSLFRRPAPCPAPRRSAPPSCPAVVIVRRLKIALSRELRHKGLAPCWCAGLGVCVRPRDIEDELAVADDAGEVAVFRELEVDVALFPLGASLPSVDRLVRGDVALVRCLVLTFCINSTRA